MHGSLKLFFADAVAVLLLCIFATAVHAQTLPAETPLPTTRPAHHTLAYASLRGKKVEDVRVMGNTQVSSAIILNVVRTKKGDEFDPDTVEEDYQRIYNLKKFANVEAKAEPTATGVIVSFIVTEQKQIKHIAFKGNVRVDTPALVDVIDIHEGEAIDNFRIAIARQSVEALYKTKNFPYAHVDVDRDNLGKTGELTFNITEGPNVCVRKIDFIGNHSFADDRLRDEVSTKYWIFVFRPGTYDPDAVDDDVAALKRFYHNKGFFDARIGRKIIESPDQASIKITFVIDEGVRYIVDKVTFKGNVKLTEAQLRKDMKLVEGQPYEADTLQRDVRAIVRAYSPFGYIYQPGSNDPDFLQIGHGGEPVKTVYLTQPGKVDLVYEIHEGKPFKLGRIIIKGNGRTQDKVVLREMRIAPGQKYNSAEIADASDRLHGTSLFTGVQMTPIGSDPDVRDLLVDVTEAHTANFGIGAGINSNGGLGGQISYEQRNFDLGDWPVYWSVVFSDRAFIGAGQRFRITLEPGTEATNASILFSEPWIFDQPYSFTGEVYYRDRVREDWNETRTGGRTSFGKRFDNENSALLTLRAEDVNIHDIQDKPDRAQEILDDEGHHTVTSIALQLRHDTTNRGMLPYKGTNTVLGWESYGLLGGEYTFQKLSANWDGYKLLSEDLLDRKTVLALHADGGWIWGSAPFFERFYAGGIGTVRGFKFRGISPRSGPEDDPIGGDFSLTGSAEVSFPLYGEILRGVVFSDVGTVEPDMEIGTIRSSIGTGIRLVIPAMGQIPIALDVALPVTKSSQDDTEWLSFSFGFQQ